MASIAKRELRAAYGVTYFLELNEGVLGEQHMVRYVLNNLS
jgi:hypothetical protein